MAGVFFIRRMLTIALKLRTVSFLNMGSNELSNMLHYLLALARPQKKGVPTSHLGSISDWLILHWFDRLTVGIFIFPLAV